MSSLLELARLFARPLLIAILLSIPTIILIALGILWLVENEHSETMLLSLAIFSLIIWWIVKLPNNVAQPPVLDRGSSLDQRARGQIRRLADESALKPPRDLSGFIRLAERIFDETSRIFHPTTRVSALEFTIPEVLLATHDISDRVRARLLAELPASDVVTLRQVKELYDLFSRNGWVLPLVVLGTRIFRLVANPLAALVEEFRGVVRDKAVSAISNAALETTTRIFVQEVGEIAVDLYAGRYRHKREVVVKQLNENAFSSEALIPIRVLVAGQVNCGKSSLTNALLRVVKSPVSELPSTGPQREFRIDLRSQFDIVICDSVGLSSDSTTKSKESLITNAIQSDLIIWIAKATQPSRSLDLETLRAIRAHFNANPGLRQPPMILVLSHIDQLSPASEWAPPYDLNDAGRRKSVNIKDAIQVVSKTLEFCDPAIPMSLQRSTLYNVAALVDAIEISADDARAIALDRALRASKLSVGRIVGQVLRGAGTLVEKSMPRTNN